MNSATLSAEDQERRAEARAIAETIVEQLGGNKFVKMTGAKNFLAGSNGVRFELGRFSGVKVRFVGIYLNGGDLYDVFLRNANDVEISRHTDVFCEDLRPLLERETGLRFRLG